MSGQAQGYGRAARLIDYMAEDGIVGEYNGSQAREVLITIDQWNEMQGGGGIATPAPTEPPAKPRNSHRVLTMAPRTPQRIDGEDLDDELEDSDDEATDEATVPSTEATTAEAAKAANDSSSGSLLFIILGALLVVVDAVLRPAVVAIFFKC